MMIERGQDRAPVAGRRSGRSVARGASPARRRSAFTLIEVMIVIAILLLLSGLVGIALFQRRDEAKRDLAKIQLRQIDAALADFRLVFERWPTEEEGVAVLWDKESLDPEADSTKWREFMAKPLPNDGWGNAWGYREGEPSPDAGASVPKYELWSNGPDGEEGSDDDIYADARPSDSGEPGASGEDQSPTGGAF